MLQKYRLDEGFLGRVYKLYGPKCGVGWILCQPTDAPVGRLSQFSHAFALAKGRLWPQIGEKYRYSDES